MDAINVENMEGNAAEINNFKCSVEELYEKVDKVSFLLWIDITFCVLFCQVVGVLCSSSIQVYSIAFYGVLVAKDSLGS